MKRKNKKRVRKTDKVYYPGEENNINEDGGEQTMEDENLQEEETVLLDENNEFVPGSDVKNFEDFEMDFQKGFSYFEIYQKDPYSRSNVFKERLEERPEEGWQVYKETRLSNQKKRRYP